uniref:Uncharacterized protein n=1 Tax=Sphaerodactylus townsendi TaxID=933632 RepID=A0ACB8EAE8_9SAUR
MQQAFGWVFLGVQVDARPSGLNFRHFITAGTQTCTHARVTVLLPYPMAEVPKLQEQTNDVLHPTLETKPQSAGLLLNWAKNSSPVAHLPALRFPPEDVVLGLSLTTISPSEKVGFLQLSTAPEGKPETLNSTELTQKEAIFWHPSEGDRHLLHPGVLRKASARAVSPAHDTTTLACRMPTDLGHS